MLDFSAYFEAVAKLCCRCLSFIVDLELVEDDIRIPLTNEDKNKKINERKSFTLPQSEKEAKMGFISKLEKTELSVAKIDGEQKRKEFSQTLKGSYYLLYFKIMILDGMVAIFEVCKILNC